MAIKSTTDYTMFTLKSDNRAKIDQTHVKRLASSIQARNLLEMRPISVNSEMEILDGQHRFLAAKSLGVPIFYEIKTNLVASDVILLNVSKAWCMADYLNYYEKNGYEYYLKLRKFMKENNISLKVALGITMGQSWADIDKFKKGEYVFEQDAGKEELKTCWDTINYIKKMNGYSVYTSSSRFWKALIKLVKHYDFEKKKWLLNLERMIDKIGPKARAEDYVKLFTDIYNWKNTRKIDLSEGD